ncbi:hypothetical protein CCO03_16280 [Comamonas serinivorans]|uniref:Uncharacterized protein n=1 Tax=Comamonas serinivorans TaxID=1082851 RepID=A0A1Y0EQT4_9BURK|nr:hypothetical protein [Comamonas serinivorans]ARU06017.1 hypothetical protein CCO03_16280 [Comamonas serinivorans]
MPLLHPLTRRRFAAGLAFSTASSAVPLAWARTTANPLTTVMQRSLGDETQAVLLWHHLSEQVQRAAMLARCQAGVQPLAQLEWDGPFQAALREDGQRFTQLPLVQRYWIQPWLERAARDWAALPVAQRTRWQTWLATPESRDTLASLRAAWLLDSWQMDGWLTDARTGQPLASPPVLAARAFQQLGQLPAVSQAIAAVDPRLAQGWARIGPPATLTVADAAWVRPLAQGLAQRAEAIAEAFERRANTQWPRREAWGDSGLGDFTQCDLLAEASGLALDQASITTSPAHWVPVSMARLCPKG